VIAAPGGSGWIWGNLVPWSGGARWGSFITACMLLGQTVLLGNTLEASETPVALTISAFSR